MTNKKTTTKKTVIPDQPVIKETREQKLSRLGAARVTAAMTKIRLIGNLTAYKPTEAQVDKIMHQIANSAQMMEARLRATKRSDETFTL